MPAKSLVFFFLLILGAQEARGWGHSVHQMVVDNARELLPREVRGFFNAGAGELREYVLEPDTVLRKEKGKKEARNHYLNLDLLEPYPFAGIPADLPAALSRFGEGKMARAGHLPWRLQELIEQLTDDFKAWRLAAALVRAGHISHYIADATQPLHGTVNYDGQKSCNHGIHQAFEYRLIDRNLKMYRKAAREAQAPVVYLDHPAEWVLELMIETYPLNKEILRADRMAVDLVKKGEGDYFTVLDERLQGLVVEQLARAGTATASCWMTAWINSGRVQLPD